MLPSAITVLGNQQCLENIILLGKTTHTWPKYPQLPVYILVTCVQNCIWFGMTQQNIAISMGYIGKKKHWLLTKL